MITKEKLVKTVWREAVYHPTVGDVTSGYIIRPFTHNQPMLSVTVNPEIFVDGSHYTS